MDGDSNCIFCRIINGEIGSHKVYEDEWVVAFMDIRPSQPGHLLVIPRKHVPDFYNLEDDLYLKVMMVVKRLSEAVNKVTNPVKVGLAVVGFEVPHTHVHVIPLQQAADILPGAGGGPPLQPSSEELAQMAALIAAALGE
ncbi:MAG: HIT domain-containing protein [Chloroflexota bacterium]|nr:HIT domain-containing protein [Chloroflexota bacterium]